MRKGAVGGLELKIIDSKGPGGLYFYSVNSIHVFECSHIELSDERLEPLEK